MTPWTAVRQNPLSMGFPRQEYWSGLSFFPPAAENAAFQVPWAESPCPVFFSLFLPSPPSALPYAVLVDPREHWANSGGKCHLLWEGLNSELVYLPFPHLGSGAAPTEDPGLPFQASGQRPSLSIPRPAARRKAGHFVIYKLSSPPSHFTLLHHRSLSLLWGLLTAFPHKFDTTTPSVQNKRGELAGACKKGGGGRLAAFPKPFLWHCTC